MTGIFEENQKEFWEIYQKMLIEQDREKDLIFNKSNFDIER